MGICGRSHGTRSGSRRTEIGPVAAPDRKQLKERLRGVQEILRQWDPIGVFPDPDDPAGPVDEYDAYAPAILAKLQEGADILKLSKHLSQLATVNMGLTDNPELHTRVARRLLEWWSRGK
jgi:hypothetical protein